MLLPLENLKNLPFPETTAVWCGRGGYGVMRLLDRIDFDVIRQNPKVFVGFSDITILHLAIQQHAGFITFHGPNLQDGFGKPDDMPLATEAALWRALMADQQSTTTPGYTFDFLDAVLKLSPLGRGQVAWDSPWRGEGALTFDDSPSPQPSPRGRGSISADLRMIVPGASRGRLTGGNLAVICGLMGTPYEIETAGQILFLEDVSERVYRIDRYLSQLMLAGKLQSAAGIVLGTFSYEDDDPPESQSAVTALLDEYCGRLNIPVIAGFPAGHAQYNLTLPMGALAEVNANCGSVKLLENPVAC